MWLVLTTQFGLKIVFKVHVVIFAHKKYAYVVIFGTTRTAWLTSWSSQILFSHLVRTVSHPLRLIWLTSWSSQISQNGVCAFVQVGHPVKRIGILLGRSNVFLNVNEQKKLWTCIYI